MESSAVLARYGIKCSESGRCTSVMPSRFTEQYYRDFYIEHQTAAAPFPFKLQQSDELSPSVRRIAYQDEQDFLLVSRELSALERKLLIFIGDFRQVQKIHLRKEVGTSVSGKRLDKALKKLQRYFLVDVWEFPRQDKAGETASAYSLTQNGFRLLTYKGLSRPPQCRQTAMDDPYQAIRCWKIADAYQVLKASAHYQSFSPVKSFPPNPYKLISQEIRKNSLGEEQKSRRERQIYLRPLTLDGELIFENPRLRYYFDLYPIVSEADREHLLLALQHWELLGDSYRYLVIIVDSWSQAEVLDQRYHLSGYTVPFLFLVLDSVQEEDLRDCLYQYDRDSRSYVPLPFKLRQQEKENQ